MKILSLRSFRHASFRIVIYGVYVYHRSLFTIAIRLPCTVELINHRSLSRRHQAAPRPKAHLHGRHYYYTFRKAGSVNTRILVPSCATVEPCTQRGKLSAHRHGSIYAHPCTFRALQVRNDRYFAQRLPVSLQPLSFRVAHKAVSSQGLRLVDTLASTTP